MTSIMNVPKMLNEWRSQEFALGVEISKIIIKVPKSNSLLASAKHKYKIFSNVVVQVAYCKKVNALKLTFESWSTGCTVHGIQIWRDLNVRELNSDCTNLSTVVSTPCWSNVNKIRFFSTALECTLWKLPIVNWEIPSDKNFAESPKSARPFVAWPAPTAAPRAEAAVRFKRERADLKIIKECQCTKFI